MDQTVISIIIGVTALVVGLITGRIFFAKNTKKQIEEAEYLAQNILKEAELRAETIKKEKQLEAKELVENGNHKSHTDAYRHG